jgi:hypothetical protein
MLDGQDKVTISHGVAEILRIFLCFCAIATVRLIAQLLLEVHDRVNVSWGIIFIKIFDPINLDAFIYLCQTRRASSIGHQVSVWLCQTYNSCPLPGLLKLQSFLVLTHFILSMSKSSVAKYWTTSIMNHYSNDEYDFLYLRFAIILNWSKCLVYTCNPCCFCIYF